MHSSTSCGRAGPTARRCPARRAGWRGCRAGRARRAGRAGRASRCARCDADLVAQLDEIADRAEMDVGRVVPGMRQQLRSPACGRASSRPQADAPDGRNSGTTRWRAGRCAPGSRARGAAARRLQGLAQDDDSRRRRRDSRRGRGRRRPGSPTGRGRTQALTPDWLSSMPRAVDPLLARQIGQQRAVAAADIEHPRAAARSCRR